MNRLRHHLGTVAFLAVIALIASGCRRGVPPQAPPPPFPPAAAQAAPPPPPPPPAAPAPAPKPAALTEEEIFARKTVDELNAERPLADVFFDLDQSTVREDARPALQKNADWLRRWTSTRISVEGHADSRGSSEYNLALSSRRAESVKAYLVTLGVPADRITVVSKGKEQPFCSEQNETCWQQNRRGHFIVTAK